MVSSNISLAMATSMRMDPLGLIHCIVPLHRCQLHVECNIYLVHLLQHNNVHCIAFNTDDRKLGTRSRDVPSHTRRQRAVSICTRSNVVEGLPYRVQEVADVPVALDRQHQSCTDVDCSCACVDFLKDQPALAGCQPFRQALLGRH